MKLQSNIAAAKTDRTTDSPAVDPSTSCCGFFICPDGDLHSRKPVEAIWIEEIGHWWNRKHRVCLQFKGTDCHEWEWDKKTRAEAVSVRDRLISILHNAETLATRGLESASENHAGDGQPSGLPAVHGSASEKSLN